MWAEKLEPGHGRREETGASIEVNGAWMAGVLSAVCKS